jgi:hypothetical protein
VWCAHQAEARDASRVRHDATPPTDALALSRSRLPRTSWLFVSLASLSTRVQDHSCVQANVSRESQGLALDGTWRHEASNQANEQAPLGASLTVLRELKHDGIRARGALARLFADFIFVMVFVTARDIPADRHTLGASLSGPYNPLPVLVYLGDPFPETRRSKVAPE